MSIIWIAFEVIINFYEGFMETYFIYKFLPPKTENTKKNIIAFALCFCTLGLLITVMNYLTIFEGILGIVCYLTALFLYALVNRKGSIIKKLFAATVPLVMISLISIITLNFVSSVNSMSIKEIVTESGFARFTVLIFAQALFFISVKLMLKLLATTSENFNAVEWIAIILILAISIIMMFLLHLIAIDSTQRLYINLLILTIVAVNIIIFYMIDSISVKNNQKKELVERLDAFFAGRGEKVEAVVDINHEKQAFEELTLDHAAEHTRAFIKVQDGCNQFCSYCIIPYARGRVRSRNVQNVLEEVKRLAASGYQEVVLTGIHLSSYGIDCEESLLHLIQMVHQVEGIRRIRLGSLEPRIVTETFAEELAKMEKICPHFHLSLQSGCDATLARMNRKYTTEEYENACNILRKNFTHPAITTDVIVGFPGETEEEFAQTKEYLKRIHFYEMHIFKYSRRQGTRAAVMEHQVPEEIKTKRSAQLLALAESMSREFRAYYVGKEEEVLFEEPMEVDGETWYTGYTKEYVKIAAKTAEPLDNVMKRGRVEAALTDEIYRMKL